MRGKILAGAVAGGLALVAADARDSRACGGCFVRPTSQSGTVVTDHRMIFAVSPSQTTLYDQIRYSGNPADFAWVLPIHGKVTLGVSSDQLFSVLDQNTQTTILAPPYPCNPCNCGFSGGSSGSGGGALSAPRADAADAGVTVIAQQVVGPYATVQLHPNSTSDTMALTAWLTANNYAIPPAVDPVIAAYVQEGFDFLAIKLVPGQGVQSMRPISVTTAGGSNTLPLRMVAAGTGATVGITLWVVSTGRYEPQNFMSFTIDPVDLVWDWSAGGSNYTTLRTQKEQAYGNAAWQIESSLDVAPYTVENTLLQDPMASSYIAVPAADGGPGQTPIEARSLDLSTIFPSGGSMVRVTRMRADLSQAALANDLVLQASMDQMTLSNVYQVTLSTNANCPVCACGGGGPSGSGSASSGGFLPFGGSGSSASGSPAGSGSTVAGGGAESGSIPMPMGSGAMGSGSTPGLLPGGSGSKPASGEAQGCSASASEPPGVALFLGLGALCASILVRGFRRKKAE